MTDIPRFDELHDVIIIGAGSSGSALAGRLSEDPATSVLVLEAGADVNNWLGRSQYPSDPYFNGKVDDFRIYNGAMTAAQVAALAAG